MAKCGKVLFSKGFEKGAKLQRTLVEALNVRGVITVSPTNIQKWYEEDRLNPVGCAHSYVLHNKKEEDIFRSVMESEEMQDESIKWKITRADHDREFQNWVEKLEHITNGITKEVDPKDV